MHVWKSDPALTMFLTPINIRSHPLARTNILEQLKRARNTAQEVAMQVDDEDDAVDGMGLDGDGFELDAGKRSLEDRDRLRKPVQRLGVMPKVVDARFDLPRGGVWEFRALGADKRDGLAIEATTENFQCLFDLVQGELQLAENNARPVRERKGASEINNVTFVSSKNSWLAKRLKADVTPRTKRPGAATYASRKVAGNTENGQMVAALFASGDLAGFDRRRDEFRTPKKRKRKRRFTPDSGSDDDSTNSRSFGRDDVSEDLGSPANSADGIGN